jgi:hypothetical protein
MLHSFNMDVLKSREFILVFLIEISMIPASLLQNFHKSNDSRNLSFVIKFITVFHQLMVTSNNILNLSFFRLASQKLLSPKLLDGLINFSKSNQ